MRELKCLEFNSMEHFVTSALNLYLLSDVENIEVVGNYDDIVNTIKEFVLWDFPIYAIHNLSPILYDKEYVLTIDDKGIWCEPIRNENGILNLESDCCFLLDGIHTDILQHLYNRKIYTVHIQDKG